MSETTTSSKHQVEPADRRALAGPSTAPLCALCNAQPAIYTCPCCHFKSCSLPCSSAHKALTDPPCTGVRNRAAYVPMAQYNYGTMVDDYTFLEDVGRHVEEWGREIIRGGIAKRGSAPVRATPMRGSGARGRGRGRGGAFGMGMDRKRFLSMQLGFRDVDMDVLPDGMERHRLNQSAWDSQKQTALLTIEFVFRPGPVPRAKNATAYFLLTHKNDWMKSLQHLVRSQVKASPKLRKDAESRQWIEALLGLDEDDNESAASPLCVMKRPPPVDGEPGLAPARPSYYRLDWTAKLSTALKSISFVEYPTIEVLDENDFQGVLVDREGASRDLVAERERERKRRKLDVVSGKKAIAALVGGYGSDDDDDDDAEEREENAENVISKLGEYADEDDTDIPQDDAADGPEAENGGEADEECDFRALLDTFGILPAAETAVAEDDEDAVDWGDLEDDAEDEARLSDLFAELQRRRALGQQ